MVRIHHWKIWKRNAVVRYKLILDISTFARFSKNVAVSNMLHVTRSYSCSSKSFVVFNAAKGHSEKVINMSRIRLIDSRGQNLS